MFKKLRTQILKMLLGAKMTTSITDDGNIVKISAVEEFQHYYHTKHYRTILITITEEVKWYEKFI